MAMDMLATAQHWLADIRKSRLATEHELVYVRQCNNERIQLTGKGVVIGNADERLDDSIVSAVDVEERDFIVPREAFEGVGATRTEPERGDIIEERDDSNKVYRFRVVSQGGETAWEWHDRERTAYRIHCQLIGVR